jgi:signal transduction histidine kinase
MSLKRAVRFLALMVFICVVVVLLARSSVRELRARAEQGFTQQQLTALQKAADGKGAFLGPLYQADQRGTIQPRGTAEPLSQQQAQAIAAALSSAAGGFRYQDHYWVYLPLKDGSYLLTRAPFQQVIAWTAGFEARETRNAVLVVAAFALMTLVWMWADWRAMMAAQKARMVEELEEKVKERTEALQRMNRLARLGEFSAGLAHEIRNPLGSLVTAAKLLPDAAGQEEEDLIKVIKQESGRLDRFLADFLDFSKDPAPRIRRSPLHPILQRTMEGLKRNEAFRRVRVTLRLDPQVKEIPCDAEQLEQAFANIALNAAQAMGGEGDLLVATRRNGRWAEIAFKDSGPGITPEQRERIFEPLFTGKRKGTGLGLSIASRIVEAHGGFIQVESDGRSWTLFTISLPLQDKG